MANLMKMAAEEQKVLALNRISQLMAEASVQYAVIGEHESADECTAIARSATRRVEILLHKRHQTAIQN